MTSLTYCTVYIRACITVETFVHVFPCLRFRLDKFTADVLRKFVIKAVYPSELTRSTSSHASCEHNNTSFLISFLTSSAEETNILRILVDYNIIANLLFSWPLHGLTSVSRLMTGAHNFDFFGIVCCKSHSTWVQVLSQYNIIELVLFWRSDYWCGFKVSVAYRQIVGIFPAGRTTNGSSNFTFASGLICRL